MGIAVGIVALGPNAASTSRAAALICALEQIRVANPERLGAGRRFTIGAWLGRRSTPNDWVGAKKALKEWGITPDNRGFLQSVTHTFQDGGAASMSFEYTNAGRVKQIGYPTSVATL